MLKSFTDMFSNTLDAMAMLFCVTETAFISIGCTQTVRCTFKKLNNSVAETLAASMATMPIHRDGNTLPVSRIRISLLHNSSFRLP